MANSDQKTFQCELIGPAGKLLNSRATSIVFPAHDGQVGVLVGHMPMLSQLGIGVMKVTQASEGTKAADSPTELEFAIDGGFALVAENTVTVIAYHVLPLQNVTMEAVKALMDRVTKNLADPNISPAERAHENERMRGLQKIADSIKS
jgi:F-type H+-transporting ATPase subunit epsilon